MKKRTLDVEVGGEKGKPDYYALMQQASKANQQNNKPATFFI